MFWTIRLQNNNPRWGFADCFGYVRFCDLQCTYCCTNCHGSLYRYAHSYPYCHRHALTHRNAFSHLATHRYPKPH